MILLYTDGQAILSIALLNFNSYIKLYCFYDISFLRSKCYLFFSQTSDCFTIMFWYT